MSIISDKIQEELATIDIKALIIERVTLKIDNVLDEMQLNGHINTAIKKKVSNSINEAIGNVNQSN